MRIPPIPRAGLPVCATTQPSTQEQQQPRSAGQAADQPGSEGQPADGGEHRADIRLPPFLPTVSALALWLCIVWGKAGYAGRPGRRGRLIHFAAPRGPGLRPAWKYQSSTGPSRKPRFSGRARRVAVFVALVGCWAVRALVTLRANHSRCPRSLRGPSRMDGPGHSLIVLQVPADLPGGWEFRFRSAALALARKPSVAAGAGLVAGAWALIRLHSLLASS